MRNKKAKALRKLNPKKPAVYIQKDKEGVVHETKPYRVWHRTKNQSGSKYIPITASNADYHESRKRNF